MSTRWASVLPVLALLLAGCPMAPLAPTRPDAPPTAPTPGETTGTAAKPGAGEGPAVSSGVPGTSLFVWPVEGLLYSRFGRRGESMHEGIDLAAPRGTEVRAAGDGTVIVAGTEPQFGPTIIVQHSDGLLTHYKRLENLKVKAGDKVRQGQVLARIGADTPTTGPHLHFEVSQNKQSVNPLPFLPKL